MLAQVLTVQVTALYDPADSSVSEANVSRTNHDMFCPGTRCIRIPVCMRLVLLPQCYLTIAESH